MINISTEKEVLCIPESNINSQIWGYKKNNNISEIKDYLKSENIHNFYNNKMDKKRHGKYIVQMMIFLLSGDEKRKWDSWSEKI